MGRTDPWPVLWAQSHSNSNTGSLPWLQWEGWEEGCQWVAQRDSSLAWCQGRPKQMYHCPQGSGAHLAPQRPSSGPAHTDKRWFSGKIFIAAPVDHGAEGWACHNIL